VHTVQVVSPATAAVPAVHCTQGVASELSVSARPAGQVVHDEEPAAAARIPIRKESHSELNRSKLS
jgi:hypothetical protein